MRRGHNSGGSEERLDTTTQRQVVFILIKQNKLIEEDSPQDDEPSSIQALDRHLTAPFKHVFEEAIEWFDGFGA